MKFLTILIFLSSSIIACAGEIPKVEPGKPLPSDLFIELAKNVNPTVVNISTKITPKFMGQSGNQLSNPMEELLEQFFGRQIPQGRGYGYRSTPQDSKPRPHSLGTGFIISKEGLIVTNSHVIDKADLIQVQLTEKDETFYDAEVIGKDPTTDIALIKIKANKDLPVAKFGSSSKLQVGEWVAAFGNPFGHGHSMTKGIISAIGRNLDDINLLPFIQTDASINPGNSGGPLVNVKGEVIGVNTAIDARAQGIGFAIPVDEVKNIVDQLQKNGTVERGFLGVQLADASQLSDAAFKELDLKPSSKGAFVVHVVPGEAAERAGIKAYDFITKFDGKKIKDSSSLSRIIKTTKTGKKTKIEFIREGRTKVATISLGKLKTENRVAEKSFNKAPEETKDALLEKYGLSISTLNKSLKKDFGIIESGKHKAVISRVVGYSQASKKGLRPGDIIYEINKSPVFDAKTATKKLSEKGSHILRVKRGSYFTLVQLQS